MARDARLNVLNAQLVKNQAIFYFPLGVYFISKIKWGFFRGFFPKNYVKSLLKRNSYLKSTHSPPILHIFALFSVWISGWVISKSCWWWFNQLWSFKFYRLSSDFVQFSWFENKYSAHFFHSFAITVLITPAQNSFWIIKLQFIIRVLYALNPKTAPIWKPKCNIEATLHMSYSLWKTTIINNFELLVICSRSHKTGINHSCFSSSSVNFKTAKN